MSKPTVIHVVGTGTIGEPLIGILSRFRKELGIDDVTFHKRTPLTTDRSKVTQLISKGARLAVDKDRKADFEKLGMKPDLEAIEALERATVVIDCTPIGNEMKEKVYSKLNGNIKGFIAQGSEFGFGRMYARGINDEALRPGEDKFVQVVSCNTHNISVLVKTLGMKGGADPGNLLEGRFLCIRRASDISQDDDFVPSPMPDKHKDEAFGTHHAHDAFHLFETLNLKPKLYSSALKLNSQYMHTLHFSIRTKEKVSKAGVVDRLKSHPLIALTDKRSTNTVFSFGRDHGIFGRILSQTVISAPTLAIKDETEVVGFCFTPQDGNSLLSSISAAMWFIDPKTYEKKLDCLTPYFFREV
ncbi:MAG: hypothetical protein KIT79_04420 [Deltaproteobacteria bacterium]|nr:hypothetical protein [Deltaproteobacteria bacterium]